MSDVIDMRDATGEPRPERDILAAHEAVSKWVVWEPSAVDKSGCPKVMHLLVIRDALMELLERRRKEQHR